MFANLAVAAKRSTAGWSEADPMKAIVLTRYGAPDVLQLKDVAKPGPGDNEVLVKVRATAVNDWDWCFVRGKPYIVRLLTGLLRPKIAVLGAEVARHSNLIIGDCVPPWIRAPHDWRPSNHYPLPGDARASEH